MQCQIKICSFIFVIQIFIVVAKGEISIGDDGRAKFKLKIKNASPGDAYTLRYSAKLKTAMESPSLNEVLDLMEPQDMVKLLRSLPPETMDTLTWLTSQNPAMGRKFLKNLIKKSSEKPKKQIPENNEILPQHELDWKSIIQKKSGLHWDKVLKKGKERQTREDKSQTERYQFADLIAHLKNLGKALTPKNPPFASTGGFKSSQNMQSSLYSNTTSTTPRPNLPTPQMFSTNDKTTTTISLDEWPDSSKDLSQTQTITLRDLRKLIEENYHKNRPPTNHQNHENFHNNHELAYLDNHLNHRLPDDPILHQFQSPFGFRYSELPENARDLLGLAYRARLESNFHNNGSFSYSQRPNRDPHVDNSLMEAGSKIKFSKGFKSTTSQNPIQLDWNPYDPEFKNSKIKPYYHPELTQELPSSSSYLPGPGPHYEEKPPSYYENSYFDDTNKGWEPPPPHHHSHHLDFDDEYFDIAKKIVKKFKGYFKTSGPKGKTPTEKVFELSIGILAFIAFGGYVFALIYQAFAKSRTVPLFPIVSSTVPANPGLFGILFGRSYNNNPVYSIFDMYGSQLSYFYPPKVEYLNGIETIIKMAIEGFKDKFKVDDE